IAPRDEVADVRVASDEARVVVAKRLEQLEGRLLSARLSERCDVSGGRAEKRVGDGDASFPLRIRQVRDRAGRFLDALRVVDDHAGTRAEAGPGMIRVAPFRADRLGGGNAISFERALVFQERGAGAVSAPE